ncbi:MAG: hypothetical protein [Microviridae sp.]|nr:MAG: hypothetical protein [Microviridae sp.]
MLCRSVAIWAVSSLVSCSLRQRRRLTGRTAWPLCVVALDFNALFQTTKRLPVKGGEPGYRKAKYRLQCQAGGSGSACRSPLRTVYWV